MPSNFLIYGHFTSALGIGKKVAKFSQIKFAAQVLTFYGLAPAVGFEGAVGLGGLALCAASHALY